MLLRSSSTPVLGSLLSSSLTDSPNCNNSTIIHHPEACLFKNHNLLPPTSPFHKHSSFHQNLSCTSSPISPSISDHQNKGFRRVQSEGNLEDSAYTSYNNEDRFNYSMDPPPPPPPKRFSARQRCLTLETIPSFSLSKQTGLREEEEDEESDFEDEEERIRYEFSTVVDSLTKEEVKVNKDDRVCTVDFGDQEEGGGSSSKKEMMYLAKGLGVDVCCDGMGGWGGNGGGGDFNSMGSGGNDGDDNNNHHGVEEYYQKMVEENPGNPLFLRNYAQFLYQCKQDREGAEEYYSRAILADPKDGEVLSQYGKLVWELHHDPERASSYFERAVQASPEDSHVHAAYASFLWDTEEDNDDGCNETLRLPPHFHQGAMAATGV